MKKLLWLILLLGILLISCKEDYSLGVIGGADGPTAVIVSSN